MGWWMVIAWIASLVISEVLRPKINVQDAKSASADEANMPTASATKPIAVIWGKCRLRDPNVVWYGDYRTVPIRKKAGKGGFMGTGKTIYQTVGYRYFWGQHLALCHGPVTLHRLWSEEREIWNGTCAGGSITIDNEGLYGGEDNGGGLSALVNFLPGDNAQFRDPYLAQLLTDVPAYRGVASLVWCGPSAAGIPYDYQVDYLGGAVTLTGYKPSGYIGTSPTPRPLTAEVSRYPQQLNPAKAVIGDDANPAEIIFECLTTDPNGPDGWGMGLSPTMVNVAAFQAAALQCHTDGFGMSLVWDNQTPIEDVIKEICRTIDATCFRDFRSGLWTIKLMRGGYDVNTLPVLDVGNILELEDFSQSAIDGTVNEVKVNYLDRSQNYKSMPAQAQDLANMRAQREVVSSTLSFRGITMETLADRVANRELFALSSSLAKANLIVNRGAYALSPGDLFVLSWAPLGIERMVVRVTKSAIGLPDANRIRLGVIQDVFHLGAVSYMVGGGTHWTDPIVPVAPVTVQKVEELPYYFNNDPIKASYMVCAQRPNSGCVTFEVWEKLQSEADYVYRDTCLTFTPVGTLTSAYTSTPGVDEIGLTLSGNTDVAGMSHASAEAIRAGANLAVFDSGEFIAFEDIINNLDGTFTLRGIWGGLFDTVPGSHSAGEKIYFFTYGASNPEDKVAQTAQIHVKNLPYGPRGAIALAQATAASLTMTGRNAKPYPPGKLQVNGLTRPASILGAAAPSWAHRNRLHQESVVRQDDDSDPSAEGAYTVQILVGGAVKRTFEGVSGTALSNQASGGPGIHYGICARSNGEVFLASSYLVIGSTAGSAPHCIYKVSPSGLTVYHGSVGAYGFVNGSASDSRYHWPQQMSADSAGNLYFSDQLHVIRRIRASDNISETFIDLTSYYANPDHGYCIHVCVDGSDNVYVFTGGRQILKITQSKVISVLAGNFWSGESVVDGMGTSAVLAAQCFMACDASGNIFLKEPYSRIRYVTSVGVVTTIYNSATNWAGGQMAVVGSDLYFSDSLNFGVIHKCTPSGTITDFATHPEGWWPYVVQRDPSPGGHLVYAAYPTDGDPYRATSYGRLSAAGVFTEIYRLTNVTGYSAAMRVQDSPNGGPVEVRVQQETGAVRSAFNTTGPFVMSGFGMCFGQIFGGKQS